MRNGDRIEELFIRTLFTLLFAICLVATGLVLILIVMLVMQHPPLAIYALLIFLLAFIRKAY